MLNDLNNIDEEFFFLLFYVVVFSIVFMGIDIVFSFLINILLMMIIINVLSLCILFNNYLLNIGLNNVIFSLCMVLFLVSVGIRRNDFVYV